MAKELRCRVGRHHWVKLTADEQVFGECSDGKDRDYNKFQDGSGGGLRSGNAAPLIYP